MITYAQRIVLKKEEESTIGFRRGYAEVAAHEMAHQWFGDLVTMAWWDDIWLNESFATWMEAKILTAWKPEWDGAVDMVDEKSNAMGSDSLKTARKIHQPIASENDIKNAFDGISYGKGASVIRTFELWVGSETFQRGIRKYLADHAWKNATSVDFLKAIGDAAGLDVVTPFSTFLDQVGSPIVSVALTCAPGATPVLNLAQKRYVPLGSTADPGQVWQIPICVKYPAGKRDERECTLMTSATVALPLPRAKTCPSWVLPNAGELGYYRVNLEGELRDRLFTRGMKKLSLPERVGVIEDVEALVVDDEVIAIELPDKYVRKDEVPAQESGPTTTGFSGDDLLEAQNAGLPAGRPGGRFQLRSLHIL
jgi:alanyl aminopeptidase